MTNKDLFIKATLVFFGITLALLLVETGLRLGGIILSTAWNLRQRQNIPMEGSYRILCLGESTTYRQWPSFLEKTLNSANVGVTFKVIDAGVPGTCTGAILSSLDERLDEFRPQMVVAMMGINDWEWIWKNAPEYEDKASVKLVLFLKETRINKLATYIDESLRNRWRTMALNVSPAAGDAQDAAQKYFEAGELMRYKGDFKKAETFFDLAIKASSQNMKPYFSLEDLYHSMGSLEKEEDVLKAGINRADANNVQWSYIALMRYYFVTGRIKDVENTFAQAIKACPSNAAIYYVLGNIYNQSSEFDKAKTALSSAIEIDSHNPQYYYVLGWVFDSLGNREKAESTFRAGIEAVPNSDLLYQGLADLYQDLGKFDQSEALYKIAIKLAPEKLHTYTQLGRLYYRNKKFKKAADTFAAAIRIDHADPWMYFELEKAYLAMHENEKASDVRSQGNALLDRLWDGNGQKMQRYPPQETTLNYWKLKNRVLERNIKLICMQYPMRPVETLMRMLDNDKRVIYVGNVENFSQALKTHSPAEIFTDMFAGDFGHCTELGNELITHSLADTILHEVFHKK